MLTSPPPPGPLAAAAAPAAAAPGAAVGYAPASASDAAVASSSFAIEYSNDPLPPPPPAPAAPSSASAFATGQGQAEPGPESLEHRDTTWSKLFWIHLVALFVGSVIGAAKGPKGFDYSNTNTTTDDNNYSSSSSITWSSAIAACLTATACAAFVIHMARRNTRFAVYFAMWSTVALTVLLALLYFAFGLVVLGVSFLLFAVFIGYYITWQTKRIGFATKIMKYSLECMFAYPATVTTSFAGVLITAVWFVLWLLEIIGAILPTLSLETTNVYNNNGYYNCNASGNCTRQSLQPTGLTAFVIIVYVFSLFWTCQVFKNVVGTTISGVAATWYFCFPVRQVVDPTRASLRRALTTSFGSICLGSLVTALLRTARFCMSMISSNNECGQCVLVCGRWILDMLDSAFTYFNHYAFAQVAIYGKTYTTAARDTLSLFKARGLDAVLNDLFVGQAVAFLSFLSGLLTALVVLIVCTVGGSSVTAVWTFLGLFIGYAIAATVLSVIESTVICFFVCLAEDPAALHATKPEIYNDIIAELENAYPQAHVVEPSPMYSA